jgi:membrane-bound metal-dependent hydrolase YbcI (DUF457 family)
MEQISPRITLMDLLGYLLAYICWLLAASLSILTALLMRNSLNLLWPLLGGNRWVLRAVDRFGLVFLGLVWLVYVIFAEHYFRTSITDARFRRVKTRERLQLRAAEAQLDIGTRALRRLGLDILLQRVVTTVAGPVALLALSFLVEQLLLTTAIR